MFITDRLKMKRPLPGLMSYCIPGCALVSLGLVGYGVFRTPSTSPLSIAAAAIALVVYGAVGWLIVPRLQHARPELVDVAMYAGLASGAIFAGEICLEYILLPADNTAWGYVEFGIVLALYACAGGWLALRGQRWSSAVIGSALSALLASIIWCVVLLAMFHVFFGTDRQNRVLAAEGDFDDFGRSGMHDFNRFITEDFLGATFFHLVLGPGVASLLGLGGAVVGRLLAKIIPVRRRGA